MLLFTDYVLMNPLNTYPRPTAFIWTDMSPYMTIRYTYVSYAVIVAVFYIQTCLFWSTNVVRNYFPIPIAIALLFHLRLVFLESRAAFTKATIPRLVVKSATVMTVGAVVIIGSIQILERAWVATPVWVYVLIAIPIQYITYLVFVTIHLVIQTMFFRRVAQCRITLTTDANAANYIGAAYTRMRVYVIAVVVLFFAGLYISIESNLIQSITASEHLNRVRAQYGIICVLPLLMLIHRITQETLSILRQPLLTNTSSSS